MFHDFYALRNEGKYNEILDVETDVAPKVQMKKLYDLCEAAYIKKQENKIKKEKDKILYEKFLSNSAKKAAISEGDPERDTKKARYDDGTDMCSLTSRPRKGFPIFHSDDKDEEDFGFACADSFGTPKKSPRLSTRKVRRPYNTRSSKAAPVELSSTEDSDSSEDDSD
jgi:hypothetical protein